MAVTTTLIVSSTTHRFARLLQLAFRRQATEVSQLLSPEVLRGEQDSLRLEHWPELLAETVKPLVTQLFQQGIVESRRRIAALQGGSAAAVFRPPQRIVVHPRHTFGERQKKLGAATVGASFDLFDPLVLRAVDKATLQFCEETNDTAVTDLKTAIRKLRKLLRDGLEEGKAVALLAREVKRIFADPARAWRIAVTESSRAIHGGALLNARQSKLNLKKEWLASSDACGQCLELEEKGAIELDEPFVVDGTGPYARVMHPPRHPHCFCTWTEVLA